MAERMIIVWYDRDAPPGEPHLTTKRQGGTRADRLADAQALRDAADSTQFWADRDTEEKPE